MGYKDIPAGCVLQTIKDCYEGKLVTDSRSPAGNWLQFTLEHIEKGTATLSIEVRHEMTNPYAHIHGGMMCLIIDEAIGWGVASMDTDNHYTSMSLNTDFLYAVPAGVRIRAMSRVIRAGKRICNVECHVYDPQDRLLAHATSNLIVTGMQYQ